MKILSAHEAINLIKNGDTVAIGGFLGAVHPEYLVDVLAETFVENGTPNKLNLVFTAGQGDGYDRGLNRLAIPGLLRRAVGGHWNLIPKLAKMALDGEIEGYNLPLGVICQLFREIAAGNPGRITSLGINTFVDPRLEGGKLNANTKEDLVEVININGEEYLWYRSFPINVGILRGTCADRFGNIYFDHEPIYAETLAIAEAANNSGGIVIVQVEEIIENYQRPPRSVLIPGILVDAVVIAPSEYHRCNFAGPYEESFTTQGDLSKLELNPVPAGWRRIIAERALLEIDNGDVVNLGIGLPEQIAPLAREHGVFDRMTLTVESGLIGGIPCSGQNFGLSRHPQAIFDQNYIFDFYDGGGLDVAFLGMAECDGNGNVNVSRFNGRLAGVGGFMNIAHRAKEVVFTGSFTAGGLEVAVKNGKVRILKEGKIAKFVKQVQQVSFSGDFARKHKKKVKFITERGVFDLLEDGLTLTELAPGINIEKDILPHIDFSINVAGDLKVMPVF